MTISNMFLLFIFLICLMCFFQNTLTGNESGSEVLPSGWNESETYSLRYIYDGNLYILRGVRADDTLIFNLLVRLDLVFTHSLHNTV